MINFILEGPLSINAIFKQQTLIYGLSLPINRSLPNKKLMALLMFFSRISSVFKRAKYLTISNFLEGGKLSKTILASSLSVRGQNRRLFQSSLQFFLANF
jgi:hypothetical protein